MATTWLGNGTVQTIFGLATTYITGSEFLTALGFFVLLVALGLAAKLDFSLIIMFTMPFAIYALAYNGEFGMLTVLLFIIGGMFAAKFWLN